MIFYVCLGFFCYELMEFLRWLLSGVPWRLPSHLAGGGWHAQANEELTSQT